MSDYVVRGDAAETAGNVPASEQLFRIAFIGDLVMMMYYLSSGPTLYVLGSAEHLNVFSVAQPHALSSSFLELHSYGYIIARVSTGTWLLPLRYLVYKSGYFPELLGILLMIAGVGYLVDLFTQFLLPNHVDVIETVAPTPAAIGEFLVLSWLLIKRINTQRGAVAQGARRGGGSVWRRP